MGINSNVVVVLVVVRGGALGKRPGGEQICYYLPTYLIFCT